MIVYRRHRKRLLEKYLDNYEGSKLSEKEKDNIYVGLLKAESDVLKYQKKFNLMNRLYENTKFKLEINKRKIHELESSITKLLEKDEN